MCDINHKNENENGTSLDIKVHQKVGSAKNMSEDVSLDANSECKDNVLEKIPPIELSLSQPPEKIFDSVERRYYTRYYKVQENTEDQVVLLHSNRICLVSLSPKHPLIQSNKKVASLEFQVGNPKKPIDRLSNKVTGKGKKGGQSVDEKAILCVVNCEDGSKYLLRSCVRGTLIEINPLIVETPSLLLEKPFSEGYLAVILPKLPEGLERLKTDLLTEEQYDNNFNTITEPMNEST